MIRDAQRLVIRDRRTEATDIVSVELARPDGGELPAFTAGSHIDVECGPDMVRQYSLYNPPAERDRYRIAVLREPRGRGGSARVHSGFEVGRSVAVSVPRNGFALDPMTRHALLLAGGIGITPLLSMAEHLSASGGAFELHYCCRTRDRAAFLNRLGAPDLAPHVRLHFDSGPADQLLDVSRVLGNSPPGTHVYVCGPAGFMDAMIQSARAFLDERAIHREYFAAPANMGSTGSERSFEIVLARSRARYVIPRDKSIATVLLENGLDVQLSCEQGICGTCLTKVLRGIPDHRDTYLSEGEHRENREMAICCSRALSDVLELDL